MANSHEVDYNIHGDDMQFVEIELDPGETVIAEAGAMMYLDDGIVFESVMGDGSEPDQGLFGKLKGAGKRAITGESLFMTHFTNRGAGKAQVSFAAPYPGKIIPVDLSSVGGRLICQKDAFLCAAKGTKVGIAFNKKLGAGFFGGEGFILQDLQGDGLAFIHAGGLRAWATPEGVPVAMTSPGASVMNSDNRAMIRAVGKIMSLVFESCITLPLTRVMMRSPAAPAGSASAVTTHGPSGPVPSKFLPGVHWAVLR